MKHRATSRKVGRSIPDGVFQMFHSPNLSGRTVALGSTQHLNEVSTREVKTAGA